MKILPILFLAIMTMTGCDDGSWADEKENLEERLSQAETDRDQMEARVKELWAQLEAEKMKTAKIQSICDLAKTAYGKLRELNIAALQYPSSEDKEVKQSSAITLLMINDAAKQACEDLYQAAQITE